MLTEEDVKRALEAVRIPGPGYSLTQLNLVRQVAITDGRIEITIATAAIPGEVHSGLKVQVEKVLKALPGVKEAACSSSKRGPRI